MGPNESVVSSITQMSADDATNLFEIIEDRTEINSTIITSQLPVSQWYDYLKLLFPVF